MYRIRYLPSIIASSLLFGFVGSPLGCFVFLTAMGIVRGHPLPSFGGFGGVAFLTAFFGAAPAFVSGIVAGILRVHLRSLPILAMLMAPIGAMVTGIYLCILMMAIRSGVPFIGMVILTGAIAAFCCSFLLWRNRPWMIPAAKPAQR